MTPVKYLYSPGEKRRLNDDEQANANFVNVADARSRYATAFWWNDDHAEEKKENPKSNILYSWLLGGFPSMTVTPFPSS